MSNISTASVKSNVLAAKSSVAKLTILMAAEIDTKLEQNTNPEFNAKVARTTDGKFASKIGKTVGKALDENLAKTENAINDAKATAKNVADRVGKKIDESTPENVKNAITGMKTFVKNQSMEMSKNAGKLLDKVPQGVKDKVNAILNSEEMKKVEATITGSLKGLGDAASKPFKEGMKNFTAIKDSDGGFEAFGEELGGKIDNYFAENGGLKGIMYAAGVAVGTSVMNTATQGMNAIGASFNTGKDMATKAGADVKKMVTDSVTNMSNNAKAMWGTAKAAASETLANLGSQLANSQAGKAAGDAYNTAKTALGTAASNLKAEAKKDFDAVKGNVTEKLASVGINVDDIGAKIKSLPKDMQAKAQKLMTDISDMVENLMGIATMPDASPKDKAQMAKEYFELQKQRKLLLETVNVVNVQTPLGKTVADQSLATV